MNICVPVRYHKITDFSQPVYDKIVDRTDFKRGQDRERAMRLTGDTGGSSTQGVYDFPDGKESSDSAPTKVEMALRGGRLDKADIDTLARVQKEASKSERQENLDKKSKAQQKAIDDARQSFIDSKTGFDSSSVTSE